MYGNKVYIDGNNTNFFYLSFGEIVNRFTLTPIVVVIRERGNELICVFHNVIEAFGTVTGDEFREVLEKCNMNHACRLMDPQ